MERKEFTILIADDEEGILEVLDNFLSGAGFNVKTAEDGLKAIEFLEKEIFDVVLVDLKMPGATGIDVLIRVKQIDPEIPVIIFTGYASISTSLKAIKEGAYDYILKPFQLEEVAVTIKNACERIKLVRENQELVENLKETLKELKSLKESRRLLKAKLDKVNREIENRQESLAERVSFMDSLPYQATLPLHYKQRRREDRGFVFNELKRLGELKEEKVIDEEEFNICKEKIIAKL
ncbi:MAG: response regulator [Thermodesulfobacteriota bacterium]|nr:response regulator [Thermodesulfobacteriota bacterium]